MIENALILKLKYICGDKSRGEDINADVFLVQTLTGSGLVKKSTILEYDVTKYDHPVFDVGEILIDYCITNKTDVIIFLPSGLHWLDPPRHYFDVLTNKMGIKTVMISGDSVGERAKRFTNSWRPFLSNVAFIDTTLKSIGEDNPKAILSILSAGQSPVFCNKKSIKDIDVCFIGNLKMPRRIEYIEYLQNNGINVVVKGGQSPEDTTISWEEYVDIINRSKISLNFCLNGCGSPQVKGHVWETLACGTFLLDDEGSETKQFLDEDMDFVMARSKEDMLEKTRYYLEHDDERESIASAGYQKMHTFFNIRNGWAYIFDEMGFSIEDRFKDESYKWFRRKMESLK